MFGAKSTALSVSPSHAPPSFLKYGSDQLDLESLLY